MTLYPMPSIVFFFFCSLLALSLRREFRSFFFLQFYCNASVTHRIEEHNNKHIKKNTHTHTHKQK